MSFLTKLVDFCLHKALVTGEGINTGPAMTSTRSGRLEWADEVQECENHLEEEGFHSFIYTHHFDLPEVSELEKKVAAMFANPPYLKAAKRKDVNGAGDLPCSYPAWLEDVDFDDIETVEVHPLDGVDPEVVLQCTSLDYTDILHFSAETEYGRKDFLLLHKSKDAVPPAGPPSVAGADRVFASPPNGHGRLGVVKTEARSIPFPLPEHMIEELKLDGFDPYQFEDLVIVPQPGRVLAGEDPRPPTPAVSTDAASGSGEFYDCVSSLDDSDDPDGDGFEKLTVPEPEASVERIAISPTLQLTTAPLDMIEEDDLESDFEFLDDDFVEQTNPANLPQTLALSSIKATNDSHDYDGIGDWDLLEDEVLPKQASPSSKITGHHDAPHSDAEWYRGHLEHEAAAKLASPTANATIDFDDSDSDDDWGCLEDEVPENPGSSTSKVTDYSNVTHVPDIDDKWSWDYLQREAAERLGSSTSSSSRTGSRCSSVTSVSEVTQEDSEMLKDAIADMAIPCMFSLTEVTDSVAEAWYLSGDTTREMAYSPTPAKPIGITDEEWVHLQMSIAEMALPRTSFPAVTNDVPEWYLSGDAFRGATFPDTSNSSVSISDEQGPFQDGVADTAPPFPQSDMEALHANAERDWALSKDQVKRAEISLQSFAHPSLVKRAMDASYAHTNAGWDLFEHEMIPRRIGAEETDGPSPLIDTEDAGRAGFVHVRESVSSAMDDLRCLDPIHWADIVEGMEELVQDPFHRTAIHWAGDVEEARLHGPHWPFTFDLVDEAEERGGNKIGNSLKGLPEGNEGRLKAPLHPSFFDRIDETRKENEERLKELLFPSTSIWMRTSNKECEERLKELLREDEGSLKDPLHPSGQYQMDDTEKDNEERLKDLLRPSNFNWADETDEDDFFVIQSEDGFPRDLDAPEMMQAAPSPGSDDEGYMEVIVSPQCISKDAAGTHGCEMEIDHLAQEGPLVHHYNWWGAPVYERSGTPPEVSLLVTAVAEKDLGPSEEYRLSSIMNRAGFFVDPVIVMLEQGAELQTEFQTVMELVRYAAGRTFRFYTRYGAWFADPQENKAAIDEEVEYIDKHPQYIVSNFRVGRKLTCPPSYRLERELRCRRESAERMGNFAQNAKPSPLRQIMSMDDLVRKETATQTLLQSVPLTCHDTAVTSKLELPIDRSHLEDRIEDILDHYHSSSESDSELGETDRFGELRAVSLRGKVEGLKPNGPVSGNKAKGLGHNLELNIVPFMKFTVFPMLLDREHPSIESEHAVVDRQHFPSSLYSREVNEGWYSPEAEPFQDAVFQRPPSSEFQRDFEQYDTTVADKFDAASFDEDARVVVNEEISLISDPISHQQPFSLQFDPAAIPLPPSPPPQRQSSKKGAGKRLANSSTLRRRSSASHTRRLHRRSPQGVINKSEGCRCRRKNQSSEAPAAAQPETAPSEPQCSFQTEYDPFNRLGIEPPRRRLRALIFLKKCLSQVRRGTRALFGFSGPRTGAAQGEEHRGTTRRKLTKRRRGTFGQTGFCK